MKNILEEISEIPKRAQICYQKNRGIKLPFDVPYLGMGSSYHAPLTLFYCGLDINPQLASEYYHYLAKGVLQTGVLISQSGKSSETFWNTELFKKIVVITNDENSPIAKSENTQTLIKLWAIKENFASTNSFFNTLVVLHLGFGLNPLPAIEYISENFNLIENETKELADKLAKYLTSRKISGRYIIGSGPNIAIAYQGALTMSETTKLAFCGLPIAQYDHGSKETAENSVLLILNSRQKEEKRIAALKKKLQKNSNALILEITDNQLSFLQTPFIFIVKLNLIMAYLADFLGIKPDFKIGSKTTTTPDSAK